MNIIQYLGGPAVGAVIGYFTNYIAVKMLFRPRREIKIGSHTLPFTPGIIPKRKNDLAEAVGKAVGTALLTEEDLSSMLLSEDVENSVAEICVTQLGQYLAGPDTVESAVVSVTGERAYIQGRSLLKESITDKIMDGIRAMEPARIIAEEGKNAVCRKLEGSMFSMFLSDKLLDSITEEVGLYAENYILEHGPAYVEEQVEKELGGLENRRLAEVKEWLPLNEEAITKKVHDIYRNCVERFAGSVVKQFHISETVERKIREMDVKELEDLVMSVMKHELGMIVNLGALIGFILGILNLLF